MKQIVFILCIFGILHLFSWKIEKLSNMDFKLKIKCNKSREDTLWVYKYYKSGNLKLAYQVNNGKKNGIYIQYYDTNVKIQGRIADYRDNKLNGLYLWFNKFGDTVLSVYTLQNKSYGFYVQMSPNETYYNIRYKNKILCSFTANNGRIISLPQINSNKNNLLKNLLGQDFELLIPSFNKIHTDPKLQNEEHCKAIFIKYGNIVLQKAQMQLKDNK